MTVTDEIWRPDFCREGRKPLKLKTLLPYKRNHYLLVYSLQVECGQSTYNGGSNPRARDARQQQWQVKLWWASCSWSVGFESSEERHALIA